jgi:flagellar hook protein FlgE
MSSTYYNSLSGMLAASYGLQNTSNNVSNMQSPGFKRKDVFYSSLGNGGGQNNLGSGVSVGGQSTNFSAGNYLETKNPADLAIVGNGFFIVKLKNGELLYTRDGEFRFNNDNMLIDKHSGGLVQGYDKNGALVSISQSGSKTHPGKATESVYLSGEFIITELAADSVDTKDRDPTKSKFERIKFDVGSIFDAQGKEHKVTLEFESSSSPLTGSNNGDNLTWDLIAVSCDNESIPFDPQTLQFDHDYNGVTHNDKSTIKIKLNNDQLVTLHFGDYGTDEATSVRLYKKDIEHVNNKIEVKKHDGYGLGKQIGYSFDENGQISYNYDNGQSEEGIHVALATFDDLEHTLVQSHDNLFRSKNDSGRRIGLANKQGFGCIQPQKIESSNVDSTTEFANIVVLQRMFQACSQIMDIDKQLLEELYKK